MVENDMPSDGQRRWRLIGRRICLLLLAVFTGCGDGAASVTGRLTLDGKPLAGSNQVRVTIMFYPESGGAPAAALADGDGRYQLATGAQLGLAPGKYDVVVVATETPSPTSEGGASGKHMLTPIEYSNPKQSKLRAEVQPGSNTFDFDLKSGAKG